MESNGEMQDTVDIILLITQNGRVVIPFRLVFIHYTNA
jgi:hypothetical protein